MLICGAHVHSTRYVQTNDDTCNDNHKNEQKAKHNETKRTQTNHSAFLLFIVTMTVRRLRQIHQRLLESN